MPCYHPIHCYKGKSKDAQKTKIVFRRSESWRGEQIDLPCGQCRGCRLERARQWAVRCMHEASLYEQNCFLTLTYDDQNLPPIGSLVKSDFQDFMKRLRKKTGPGIRYFHCGEYGEKLFRPHYHALIFNWDPPDRKFYAQKGEFRLFTSEMLSSVWQKGICVVGDVSFESASYVARYVMKKVTGEKALEHYGFRVPEYTTMSRGSKRLGTGGIGKGWFDSFKADVYPRDRVMVRGHATRPPRFYDDLYGREDPSSLALLKIAREKNGQHFVEDVLSDGRRVRVSDSCDARLLVKEVCKEAQLKQLRRSLEEI